jgi:hypothetical protein
MTGYNGHKNWTHWNVSLWLNNDEDLYRQMRKLSGVFTREVAARKMLQRLPTETPDGAKYSVTSIRAAMRD